MYQVITSPLYLSIEIDIALATGVTARQHSSTHSILDLPCLTVDRRILRSSELTVPLLVLQQGDSLTSIPYDTKMNIKGSCTLELFHNEEIFSFHYTQNAGAIALGGNIISFVTQKI